MYGCGSPGRFAIVSDRFYARTYQVIALASVIIGWWVLRKRDILQSILILQCPLYRRPTPIKRSDLAAYHTHREWITFSQTKNATGHTSTQRCTWGTLLKVNWGYLFLSVLFVPFAKSVNHVWLERRIAALIDQTDTKSTLWTWDLTADKCFRHLGRCVLDPVTL